MSEPLPSHPEPPVDTGPRMRAVEAGEPVSEGMSGMRHYLLVRHRHNWELLFKFCVVGGSGFIVNLAVFAGVLAAIGSADAVWLNLPLTEFNVRGYHAFSMIAFAVANVTNYLLNRSWTFGSRGTAHWLHEYVPFLAIGLAAQAAVLMILTLLQHQHSPLHMDSVTLAQAIAIVVVTPLSFLGNKLWTFRRVRAQHRAHLDHEARI